MCWGVRTGCWGPSSRKDGPLGAVASVGGVWQGTEGRGRKDSWEALVEGIGWLLKGLEIFSPGGKGSHLEWGHLQFCFLP